MITRLLPSSEWSRLADSTIGHLIPNLDPARTDILVVEDGDQIVGHLVWMKVDHVDGAWIHPDYRKGPVTSRLWRGMRRLVRESGAKTFLTAADRPDTMRMFRRATKVPAQEYVICLQPS